MGTISRKPYRKQNNFFCRFLASETWPLAAVVGGLLLAWPLCFPKADLYYQVLGMACFYGVLAMAWNILALAGGISLGHSAFFGLGAYGSGLLAHYQGWSPAVTIPLGAMVGAGYGVLWGIFFQRLRGVYFGLATLAAVEIPRVIIDNWGSFTYGSLGLVGIPGLPDLRLGAVEISLGASLRALYYFLLALMCLAGALHFWVMHSRWGWGLRAIRENEAAAAMLGVNVRRSFFLALLLSSFLAGLCGGLYAHLLGLIEPALVFSLHLSALPLVLSIFGGRFHFLGPLLGALLLYPLDQLVLQPYLPMGHAAIYGVVIIATIFFWPRGLTTCLSKRRRSV